MKFLTNKFKIKREISRILSGFDLGLAYKLVTVLLIGLFLFFYFTHQAEIVVELPVPDANLYAKQTFKVSLINVKNPENYKLVWTVDGGVLSDRMVLKGDYFESIVDIDNWDWKKDNSYQLEFSAYNQKEVLVAQKSIRVFSGATYQDDVTVNQSTEILKQSLATVSESFLSSEETAPAVDVGEVASNKILSIDWLAGPSWGSQNFVFNVKGYLSSDISVFWQVEGGHRNFVFETDNNGRPMAVINFSGWHWLGNGPYPVSFIVVDKNSSNEIARENLYLIWDNSGPEPKIVIERENKNQLAVETNKDLTLPAYVAPELPKVSVVNPAPSSLPFRSDKLYVHTKPAVEASLKTNPNSEDANTIRYLLSQPGAIWLNGDGHDSNEFLSDIVSRATVEGALPVFVLYNIPHRDCGSHSSGGANLAEQYRAWIDRLTTALRGVEMIVVVEPDALAQLNCLPTEKQKERLALINYATESLTTSTRAHVYIDAGHPFWVNAEEMSLRLKQAGVDKAKGFALNVSNFVGTEDNIRYGNYLSNLLAGKKYVIDTSRNGNGPDKNLTWCNPSGRALGQAPSLNNSPNHQALDAFLWIKFPGESDGTCNGGPNAGSWWLDYALDLARR